MDTDLLILLALLGFYLFRQFAARKQQPAQPGPESRRLPADRAEPEFDDALDEIRRALGFPAEEAAPERPVPSRAPERQRPEPARSRPAATHDEFRRVDTGRPDLEDRFERARDVFRDPLAGHTHARPRRSEEEPPATRPKRRLLATRKQLRDAFVMKEIVGPPRARKREIR